MLNILFELLLGGIIFIITFSISLWIKWIWENPKLTFISKKSSTNLNDKKLFKSEKIKNVTLLSRRINLDSYDKYDKEYLKGFFFMELDDCENHFIFPGNTEDLKDNVYLFAGSPNLNDLYCKFQENNHNADFIFKIPKRVIPYMSITKEQRKIVMSRKNQQNISYLERNKKCYEEGHDGKH